MTGAAALAATAVAALLLAAVQVLPRFLAALEGERRRWVVSAAGGFSVGFVFVYLLPKLTEFQEDVDDLVGWLIPFFDHDVYVLALAGLILFYGLERAARVAEHRVRMEKVTIAVLALYYAVIGHLLWDEVREGLTTLIPFTVAMGLHFLVVDYGLREHHETAYVHAGWWFLAVAVLAGWGVGAVLELPPGIVGVMVALVAGGVALVALKEELPAEREGRFGFFLAGAVAAIVLLIAV
jgi:hypothetical protein